jgi:predicted nucleic acid-binding protein
LPVATARDSIVEFADMADVVTISVSLITAATRRVEASSFSFWDSLIIGTAIGCGAQRLWTEDFQDGQTVGELMIVNPFGAPIE